MAAKRAFSSIWPALVCSSGYQAQSRGAWLAYGGGAAGAGPYHFLGEALELLLSALLFLSTALLLSDALPLRLFLGKFAFELLLGASLLLGDACKRGQTGETGLSGCP